MDELKSIELRRKIQTEVFFANGASEIYFVESYSTIEDLKHEVIQRYELDEKYYGYFGILEYCKKNELTEETFVDDHVKIQDVVSSWLNEVEFLTKKMKEESLKLKFKLYFKIRFDFQSDQLSHKVLKYYECVRRFKKNRYSLDYATYKRLLGLKLRIDFGNLNEDRNIHIHCNFKHLTPKLDRERVTAERYNSLIEEVYNAYVSNT